MSPVVASLKLIGRKDGETFPVELSIGTPYQPEDGRAPWACPASLSLHDPLRDACGEDAFQALCLATSRVQVLLQDFLDEGGTLHFLTGEPWPLEAYRVGGIDPPAPPR